MSQSPSEDEQVMDDVNVARNKKKKKENTVTEAALTKDMSDDDLMKISQKRKNRDSGQKNKLKKANKEAAVSAEPESDLLQS